MMKFMSLGLLFCVSLSWGATYQVVDAVNGIKDRTLNEWVRIWDDTTEDVSDTGYKAVTIIHKKETEKWENTIQQILWERYVESIDIEKISFSNLDSAMQISIDLIDASAWFEIGPEEKVNLAYELGIRLKKVASYPTNLFYTGNIYSAFDGAHMFIAVVDKKNKQIVVVYGGYSE